MTPRQRIFADFLCDTGKQFVYRPKAIDIRIGPGAGRAFSPTFVVLGGECVAYQVDSALSAAEAYQAVSRMDALGVDLVLVDDEAFPFDEYLNAEDPAECR